MSVFDANGFEIFPDAVSPSEVASICHSLDDFVLPHSRAGIRHALRHPAVAALANSHRLLRFAERILDGPVFAFRATVFDKSPASNWLVVWHQDTALPIQERREEPGWGPWSIKEGIVYAHAPASALEQIVALRVHLDDSRPDNGPLRVLPRSHKDGVLSDDAIHQLAESNCPVECTVPSGGVLAMRPLIIHSSSKSKVAVQRRVLHIEYSRSSIIAGGLRLATA
jgi:ectoine hydroxylase-related dioxygenase (phytanoyl-CoA dioxygenase family)